MNPARNPVLQVFSNKAMTLSILCKILAFRTLSLLAFRTLSLLAFRTLSLLAFRTLLGGNTLGIEKILVVDYLGLGYMKAMLEYLQCPKNSDVPEHVWFNGHRHQ
ncbi:hypothetical protein GNI_066630 [Gregarina niphandrodes]|uniref:Uncharacterized protein n=1 Tax=Gregarina niphandrodes TaxID=110365 RepID=A0A023B7S4_GRENI|nr:hypothetical protein GNI_066630 [Gregarina niphandrodes]EZG67683.1 hypothetical protein GNI_066630 [Gregarina niphandrodes]|eukprot:XP_011130165.1 hypothetical protein GNI_066630 [Gregarina niphandrodes]